MVKINRILMNIEPDNGSEANITDEQQFRHFKLQKPEIQLEKSKTKLKSLFEVIPVIRQCTVTIENQKQQTRTQIIVIKGKIDSLLFKGRRTLSNLRMVIIDETRRLSKQIGKLKQKLIGPASLITTWRKPFRNTMIDSMELDEHKETAKTSRYIFQRKRIQYRLPKNKYPTI